MSTRVRFYHNTREPLALARELIASAVASGRKVAVRLADAASLRRLDQMLWTLDPLSFIPHVTTGSALAAETPVVLASMEGTASWPHEDLLFNLAADADPACIRFRAVIEIVGNSEAEILAARRRWKHYLQLGLSPQAEDAALRGAP